MASDTHGEEVRAELIRFLKNADWQVTESARVTAYPLLRAVGQRPTDAAIIEYVARLLESDFPTHAVPLGEPPGSAGMGYVMNNADGRGLYIKMKIERREAWVISFHVSKHHRG